MKILEEFELLTNDSIDMTCRLCNATFWDVDPEHKLSNFIETASVHRQTCVKRKEMNDCT